MRPRPALLSLYLVILAISGGCHRSAPRVAPSAPATLEVENHNRLDVEVYLLHQGQRTRLGLVTAATRREFAIPERLLTATAGVVRFQASAIGSGDETFTDLVTVRPGTLVRWSLEARLSQSSVTVY